MKKVETEKKMLRFKCEYLITSVILLEHMQHSKYPATGNKPTRNKPKRVTRGHKGRRDSSGPLPSTFATIHPIAMIFATYN